MAKQLTEEYLDKKLEDSFTEFGLRLFQHLDRRFDEVDKRFDTQDEKYEKLVTTLDAFLKRLDDLEKDNMARDAQISRIERWIEQVAQKTGVKLEY